MRPRRPARPCRRRRAGVRRSASAAGGSRSPSARAPSRPSSPEHWPRPPRRTRARSRRRERAPRARRGVLLRGGGIARAAAACARAGGRCGADPRRGPRCAGIGAAGRGRLRGRAPCPRQGGGRPDLHLAAGRRHGAGHVARERAGGARRPVARRRHDAGRASSRGTARRTGSHRDRVRPAGLARARLRSCRCGRSVPPLHVGRGGAARARRRGPAPEAVRAAAGRPRSLHRRPAGGNRSGAARARRRQAAGPRARRRLAAAAGPAALGRDGGSRAPALASRGRAVRGERGQIAVLLVCRGRAVRGERGQIAVLLIGGLLAVAVGGLVLGAFARGLGTREAAQRAADLGALGGARAMHEAYWRLFEPPLSGGLPNPRHLEKGAYLALGRAAAVRVAAANGAPGAAVEFPDGDTIAPARVRVSVVRRFEIGGRGARMRAVAEAELAPPAGVGPAAFASGAGYDGPLAYRTPGGWPRRASRCTATRPSWTSAHAPRTAGSPPTLVGSTSCSDTRGSPGTTATS